MAWVVSRTLASSSAIRILAFIGTIATLRQRGTEARCRIGCAQPAWRLAVPRHSAQFPGLEVVGRPGATDQYFTVFQLLGSHVVAILIFVHRLVLDEVGDIDQHAVGINLLAGNLLVQGVE